MQCKCCLAEAEFVGNVDFNKTCQDRFGAPVFPVGGIAVPYNRCANCGFVFTNYFDDWTPEQWREKIYNDEYDLADAPFGEFAGNTDRRKSNSYSLGMQFVQMLEASRDEVRILDYGSGGDPGDAGLALLDHGFCVSSYDPYRGITKLPPWKFEVIICNMVVEHCCDVEAVAKFFSDKLTRNGFAFVETCWMPSHPFAFLEVPHCYDNIWVAPRNGHVSMFTFRSMAELMFRHKLNFVHTPNGHIAFRRPPNFFNNFLWCN